MSGNASSRAINFGEAKSAIRYTTYALSDLSLRTIFSENRFALCASAALRVRIMRDRRYLARFITGGKAVQMHVINQ